MKTFCLTLLALALGFLGSACERKTASAGGTDDAKVRPEVAAARGAPSPSVAATASP